MSRRLATTREPAAEISENQRAPEPLEDLDTDEEGEGSLEIFVESTEEKPQTTELHEHAHSVSSADYTLFKHPKLSSLKDMGVKLLGLIEELLKNQNDDSQVNVVNFILWS